ncbi:outer membrane beta-barrel family protein [Flavobacterium sp.]|uniref:outer membrane beta-barrel family protein n=1 Tax=Flavobacterium sp. TaxID=239 RepID=UPI00262BFBDC|nr:outer membrane beta-barrel family protein [Flavobacterium sp.]MDD3003721.1 outer membrane beta-barrel family protein [Flavobacterium sp.]
MRHIQFLVFICSFLFANISFAQQSENKRVKVAGKVIDKITKQPLEYTTITFIDVANPSAVSGGITDAKGEFSFDIKAGTYNITVEFISFKPITINNRVIQNDANLGTFSLVEDATLLDAVEIRREESTVEIKLDKKVYNVGQDMMVKGGTVSDVLDNVPSVSVDVEGNVSLRGNENVRILIDGKPSGLGGINIAEALKLIPAETIDKVEVITNPSARYDAEGGGGILNIVLKKGKNLGVNGTVTTTVGNPDNYGINGTINLRSKNFNVFTTQGYSYRKGPGNSLTDTEYIDAAGNPTGYLYERRNNERLSKGYNGNLGFEWFVTPSISWTNTVSYRNNKAGNPDDVFQRFYDQTKVLNKRVNRFNDESGDREDIDFSTNFIKKFKKDGHQLIIDGSYSFNNDDDNSLISIRENDLVANTFSTDQQQTANNQRQKRILLQADYVLPIGEKHRFEAGYRGNITDLTTDYAVEDLNNGVWENNAQFTNVLQYKENVNALYTQFGSKINKFSYLLGLRFEDSNIEINQFTQAVFNDKKYNNLFPSAFLTYELGDFQNISLSYSKRISRPRSRFINPFSSLSSNINLFRGNPDLDPSLTDAYDLGYLKKWNKFTFNTSMYFNRTKDAVQFVRNTEIIDATAVLVTSPVNVGSEDRFGFEFTLSYNPYKWWRLNSNFNFFRNQTKGNYTFVDLSGNPENIDFSNTALSWFTRITSKVTLPWGIDWQTNGTYNAPQTNAQGKSKGILSMNLAFSKDILKDKGTLALNVSDVFNSRKRITETNLLSQNAYSEFQWRERQINLSLTYRFNRSKNEREKPRGENNREEEFIGG